MSIVAWCCSPFFLLLATTLASCVDQLHSIDDDVSLPPFSNQNTPHIFDSPHIVYIVGTYGIYARMWRLCMKVCDSICMCVCERVCYTHMNGTAARSGVGTSLRRRRCVGTVYGLVDLSAWKGLGSRASGSWCVLTTRRTYKRRIKHDKDSLCCFC